MSKDLQPPVRLFRGSLSARHYIRNDSEVRFKAELHTFMEVIEERSRIPFLTLFPCGVTSIVDGEIGIFRRVPPMIHDEESHAQPLARFPIGDCGSRGIELHITAALQELGPVLMMKRCFTRRQTLVRMW